MDTDPADNPRRSRRSAPSSRPRGWRRLKWAILIVLAGYLALEGIAWCVYTIALDRSSRRAVEDVRGPHGRPLGPDGLVPHPYSLFQLEPRFVDERGVKQVNSLGWRGPETSPGKPAGTRRVICVGGGTTYGLGVARPEEAYPAQLEAFLRRETQGPSIEVINAGTPHASSAEIFGTVAFRVLHHDPDVVVLQVGLEDVNALLAPGYDPDYPDYTHWRKSWIAPEYDLTTRRLLTSPLYRMLFVGSRLPAPVDRRFQRRPDPAWDDPALKDTQRPEPTGFRNNIENALIITVGPRELRAQTGLDQPDTGPIVTARRGIKVLLVTERLRRPYPLVEWALAEHRQILRQLADKYNAPLYRFDLADVPDDAYTDDRHLNAKGQALKARYIGRCLLDHNLLEAPETRPASRPGAATQPGE